MFLGACGGTVEGDSLDAGAASLDETGSSGDAGSEHGEEGTDTGPAESGGDTEPEPPDCAAVSFSLDSLTPNVMLVLDKSTSMREFTWDHDGDPNTAEVTRWFSLHQVVSEITTLHEADMNLGVTLFPSADADPLATTYEEVCAVNEMPEVDTGPSHAEAIQTAMPAADSLDFGGATPARAGMAAALSHLKALDDGLPSSIIFITDGAANCASTENFVTEYDQALTGLVLTAREADGIGTHVVGIDIGPDGGAVEVNPQLALFELAIAGGYPSDDEFGYYDAATPEKLDAALDEITAHIACQLDLGVEVESLDGMVIDVDGTEYEQLDDCSQGDGWVQLDPQDNPTKIELCNAACESATDTGSAEAKFPCPADPTEGP